MIPESQLAHWEQLCREATKEPWEAVRGRYDVIAPNETNPQMSKNQAFIAEAWTALPALLAEVKRLRDYPKRPIPTFNSAEEELDYWRTEAVNLDTWYALATETRNELEGRAAVRAVAIEKLDKEVARLHDSLRHYKHLLWYAVRHLGGRLEISDSEETDEYRMRMDEMAVQDECSSGGPGRSTVITASLA